MLPLQRLEELVREGFVGKAADAHYSIMGYQLRSEVLEGQTAPPILADMKARGVDAVALVPA